LGTSTSNFFLRSVFTGTGLALGGAFFGAVFFTVLAAGFTLAAGLDAAAAFLAGAVFFAGAFFFGLVLAVALFLAAAFFFFEVDLVRLFFPMKNPFEFGLAYSKTV
jgi:hypothetical protein